MEIELMANVMITGGSGLLGWRIVEQLLEQGHEVTIFDLVINHENIGPFSDRITKVQGDINDLRLMLATMKINKIDHVVHLAAAIGHVSHLNPAGAFRTNIVGTTNVFDCAVALGIRRVVWASSAAVLQMDEGYDNRPLDEEFMPRSTDAYGISKIACESLAKSYANDQGLDSIAIRPHVTYGLGRMDSAAGLFNTMFRQIALGQPAEVSGTSSLHQPMYHRDMARLMITALFGPKPQHIIFNAPVYKDYTDEEFVDALLAVQPDARISLVPRPDWFRPMGVMDGTRAKKELGFKAEYSLEDGAREMIDLFRAQIR
jgi:nucleoside-diphosphate-sugar epimerase